MANPLPVFSRYTTDLLRRQTTNSSAPHSSQLPFPTLLPVDMFSGLYKSVCVPRILSLITSTSNDGRTDGRRCKKPTAATGTALRISWTNFLFSRLRLPWGIFVITHAFHLASFYTHGLLLCLLQYTRRSIAVHSPVYCSTLAVVNFWCMLTEVALPPTPRFLQVLGLSNRTWGHNYLVGHGCCPTKSWKWSLTPEVRRHYPGTVPVVSRRPTQ